MKIILFAFCFLLFLDLCAQNKTASGLKEERLKLAQEMEQSLNHELLNKWYPHSADTIYGGFFSTYTYDFKLTGPQDKFIVTQARHTWTTAKAAELFPEKTYYLQNAKHGFEFLRDVMWDKTNGGFYNIVDRQGKEKSNQKAPKEAYGNAFALYALAAYYKASGDTGALSLAKKAFNWLETHGHDPVHKGYFQHLQADGTPVKRDNTVVSTSDIGYKDQNSSIHILEALTELYGVWKDELVKERLQEMLYLIRDKIVDEKGSLTLFLTADWKPVSFRDSTEASILKHKNLDHVSFGHDVETAYLMMEASHVLGLTNDTRTLAVGKKMVDHALANGWDEKIGGFYDEGYYFKDRKGIAIIADTKNWWAQAEGLNVLLLMADMYPRDPMRYFEKFRQLWNYTDTYLIDHEHGDWYEGGLDKQPQKKTANKGHIWKGTYHHFRSLANCIERLKGNNH